MSEQNLWTRLKYRVPRGHHVRVENAMAGPGTPDVYYRLRRGSGWLELKHNPRRAKVPFPNQKKGLHRSQLNWIAEEIAFGGLVWVVAQVDEEMFWIHGRHAPEFNGATLKKLRSLAALVYNENYPDFAKIQNLMEGGDNETVHLFGPTRPRALHRVRRDHRPVPVRKSKRQG